MGVGGVMRTRGDGKTWADDSPVSVGSGYGTVRDRGGGGRACYELSGLERRWVVLIEKGLVIETSALTERCARE
jgi:hypothetical protein